MGKKILSITVEESILRRWKEYTEEECINSSKLIERMIDEHMNKRLAKSAEKSSKRKK